MMTAATTLIKVHGLAKKRSQRHHTALLTPVAHEEPGCERQTLGQLTKLQTLSRKSFGH
jgi:hypothetical protein